jgi:hypothetical protein
MREDWLEQALAREDNRLPDEGFTLRVMAALPPRAEVRPARRADWILLAGTAAGSAVAASFFPAAPVLRVLVEAAQIPWIGGGVMLCAMALALLAEPLRRAF